MSININNIDLSKGEEMQHLETNTVSRVEMHLYNSEQIRKERLDKCLSCQYVTTERMCSECNCPVVMMSQFNFKQCPKGYWQ